MAGGSSARSGSPPTSRSVHSARTQARTSSSPRTGYRLCAVAGLAKLAVAGQEPQQDLHRRATRARWEWLLERLATPDRGLREQALRDVQAGSASVPGRHAPARVGLLTIARLLADCEPFRVRWALQHWPYPLAKLTRAWMSSASQQSAQGLHGESLILRAAWDRLALEGRLPLSWPGPN